MDTIIEEILNDIWLWNKAAISLTLDGLDFWYRMVNVRVETLRQEQEKQKKQD
jgi:hypothetical protein